jgi:hypothetical protein
MDHSAYINPIQTEVSNELQGYLEQTHKYLKFEQNKLVSGRSGEISLARAISALEQAILTKKIRLDKDYSYSLDQLDKKGGKNVH